MYKATVGMASYASMHPLWKMYNRIILFILPNSWCMMSALPWPARVCACERVGLRWCAWEYGRCLKVSASFSVSSAYSCSWALWAAESPNLTAFSQLAWKTGGNVCAWLFPTPPLVSPYPLFGFLFSLFSHALRSSPTYMYMHICIFVYICMYTALSEISDFRISKRLEI